MCPPPPTYRAERQTGGLCLYGSRHIRTGGEPWAELALRTRWSTHRTRHFRDESLQADQPIAEVESDKVILEVEPPYVGVVLELLLQPGQDVTNSRNTNRKGWRSARTAQGDNSSRKCYPRPSGDSENREVIRASSTVYTRRKKEL